MTFLKIETLFLMILSKIADIKFNNSFKTKYKTDAFVNNTKIDWGVMMLDSFVHRHDNTCIIRMTTFILK